MFETVAIVGLGLMGGSLALALHERRAVRQLIGIDVDPAALAAAQACGAVDSASSDFTAARDASVIVLATPVRTILRQLPTVAAIAPDGALLLDLGSTKRQVVAAMDRLPARLFAIGGHPLCGKETSGFQAADAALFVDKTFVLTPTARSSAAALRTAAELAEVTGAHPLVMGAERHDQIAAAMSHLPFVVAANLVETVNEWTQGDDSAWQLAASGFRDTSRLAASDSRMMLDILMTNSENIADLMRRYSRSFAALADLIYAESEQELTAHLETAASRRRSI